MYTSLCTTLWAVSCADRLSCRSVFYADDKPTLAWGSQGREHERALSAVGITRTVPGARPAGSKLCQRLLPLVPVKESTGNAD